MGSESEELSFVDRVSRLMERVEYRRADSLEEKAAIYRMRHDAYTNNGSIEPRPSGLFHDAYDEEPNTWLIAVLIDGELAGSIRIHVAANPESALPAMRAFSDVIGPRMRDGNRCLIDATRHVNKLEFSRRYPEMPLITMRPGFLAERYFGVDYLIGACRAENRGAFRRMLGVSQWAAPRVYPGLTGLWALMAYDCETLRATTYKRYPFYRSTFEEQAKLFFHSSTSKQDAHEVIRSPSGQDAANVS